MGRLKSVVITRSQRFVWVLLPTGLPTSRSEQRVRFPGAVAGIDTRKEDRGGAFRGRVSAIVTAVRPKRWMDLWRSLGCSPHRLSQCMGQHGKYPGDRAEDRPKYGAIELNPV